MKFINYLQIFLFISAFIPALCGQNNLYGQGNPYRQTKYALSDQVQSDSLNLFDKSRKRAIPLALYYTRKNKEILRQKIVIFNHGYGANIPGSNKAYTYLTTYLATKGYFVASIQHELPTDALLPSTGNIRETRTPFWQSGVENIVFVIGALKKQYPHLDYRHIAIIGHSNGGDISMRFATQFPELVEKVISLDNRRVPFPGTSHPKLYSLRSNDQPADEGVLPNAQEQQKFGIKIIQLNHTSHNDMDDSGTAAQHQEINTYVLSFLRTI